MTNSFFFIAPKEAPKRLNGTLLSKSTISLSWQRPPDNTWNCGLDGYKVIYNSIDSFGPFSELILPCSVSTYTVTGLILHSIYEFKVAAYNSKGKSAFSPSIYIRTGDQKPTGTPSNVTVSSVNSTTLLITWTPPTPSARNGLILGYIVTAKNLQSSRNITIPAYHKSVYLYNLQKDTNYTITIASYNMEGKGPESKPVHIKTNKEGKVLLFIISILQFDKS